VMDPGVVSRDKALRVRQHPVVISRSADIAAGSIEHHRAAFPEQSAVITDYAKLQRHRRPRFDKYSQLAATGRWADI
jgi:hypothetical protein